MTISSYLISLISLFTYIPKIFHENFHFLITILLRIIFFFLLLFFTMTLELMIMLQKHIHTLCIHLLLLIIWKLNNINQTMFLVVTPSNKPRLLSRCKNKIDQKFLVVSSMFWDSCWEYYLLSILVTISQLTAIYHNLSPCIKAVLSLNIYSYFHFPLCIITVHDI